MADQDQQQQPQTGAAPAPQQNILMIAPDGTQGYVPESKVPDAVNAGGKVGVRMTAPDGTQGVIPFDSQDQAQKGGAKWDAHPDNDAVKAYYTKQQTQQKAQQQAQQAQQQSDVRTNMTRAMSGQQLANPEEQQKLEKGKKAGMIDAAATALTGPASEWSLTKLSSAAPSIGAVIGEQAAKHPLISKAVGTYASWMAVHLAHKLGLPLPKILEAIGE
jgi:hypothetical protein